MHTHRTLAVAAVVILAALLPAAGVSFSPGSAGGSDPGIALLDRPALAVDQLPPAVAKAIDADEVDVSTVRLGASKGSLQFFVARGKRGLCLIRVDDPIAPAFTTTCASTLIAGGVYLASLDRTAGTMQIADIVPDDVSRASIDGTLVSVTNNLLVTGDIPIGASIELIGSAGEQQVPVRSSTSVIPIP
jgi:hypothetical protein